MLNGSIRMFAAFTPTGTTWRHVTAEGLLEESQASYVTSVGQHLSYLFLGEKGETTLRK